MNRSFLTLLLTLAWICEGSSDPLAADQTKRPNVLLAFADDWGRHASIYAAKEGPGGINDLISTPNFDRIAREGVLFRNAFVNAPSCTPCRSSLLSGQYFWRTGRGAILRGAVWDMSIPSWPLILRDGGGYHIGKSYKVWGPGTPANAPYDQNKHAYESGGSRINQFSQNMTTLVSKGAAIEAARAELLDEVRVNFRAFLADQKEGQPFCFWYGATNVHRKWTRGSGKALWQINPDDLEGKMPPFLPDVPTIREDLADYLGEAQAFDAELGVLVEELETAGQYENTIIAISGDHGPAGFPHGKCNLYDFGSRVSLAIKGPGVKGGRFVDDFVSLPDLAPTFLDAGRQEIPEVMTAKSLWTTLVSDQEGLVDETRTQVYIGRERHVEMARAGYLPYPQRAIRTAEYLFVINFHPERYPLGDPYGLDGDSPSTVEEITEETFVTHPDEDAGPTKAWLVDHRQYPEWKPFYDRAYGLRPREELYDVVKDPHQMNNLAAEPAHAEALSKLRTQLVAELTSSGDPRMIDDGKFFETAPMAGPLPDDVPKPNRGGKKPTE